jgi:hypothetical protein
VVHREGGGSLPFSCAASLFADLQLPKYMLGKKVLDLAMARNGLRGTCLRILVPVVLATVPDQ